MNFVNIKPILSADDFASVDAVLGFPFPEELRSHYLRFNGGHPVRNLFVKDGRSFSVEEFLPIKYGMRGQSLEDTYRTVVLDNELFPTKMIPIANDASGDYFCYSIRPGEVGSIYFFRSEYYDDPKRSLIFLSNDLPTFLASLVKEDPV